MLRGFRPWTNDTWCSSPNAFKPNLNTIKQHATITTPSPPPSSPRTGVASVVARTSQRQITLKPAMCTHARTKVQDVRPEEDSGSGVRHTCGSKPMSWTSHNTGKLASIPQRQVQYECEDQARGKCPSNRLGQINTRNPEYTSSMAFHSSIRRAAWVQTLDLRYFVFKH